MIVDSSATIAWVNDEDGKAEAIARLILNETIVVPPLWRLELANVFALKRRHKRMSDEQVEACFTSIDSLRVRFVDPFAAWTLAQIVEFAEAHRLTTYDATYLAVAQAEPADRLLSFDAELIAAARNCGVTTVAV